MRHSRSLLLATAAATGLAGLSIAAASTPSSSKVTASSHIGGSAKTTWSGVVPGGANADSACAGQVPQLEDHHTVQISIPKGLYDHAAVRLEVTTDFTAPVDPADTILTLRYGKNAVSSDNYSVSAGEHLFLFNPPAGTYDVAVCTFAGGPSAYTGVLKLDTISKGTGPAPLARGKKPGYKVYPAPLNAERSGEPSIGADWQHNTDQSQPLMYQSGLSTYKVTIVKKHATWTDVSPFNNVTSLDPILFTDRYTGRTFTSQLTGQDSLAAFTDNNGASWTPSQGGGMPSGVDHQSLGGGPYPKMFQSLATPLYKDAVYYCSQDLVTALCARSDNGGLTFGAGVPIYETGCSGLHGHVKVAPDGTVYVPNKACNGQQAAVVSTDAGNTWTTRPLPHSTNGSSDPSLAIDDANRVYYAYADGTGLARVAVSSDRGKTWTHDVDLGYRIAGHPGVHIRNSVFPEAIAASKGRAAVAFLGTPTAGDTQSDSFGKDPKGLRYVGGEWHLYIATTYNGGKSWVTVDATPKDPVQRGKICLGGIGCSGNTRNLLDFNDITLDRSGRVAVAFTDGCTISCVTSKLVASNSHSDWATIARQESGKPLVVRR